MIKKELISCNLCDAKEFNVFYPDELGDVPPKIDYDFSPDMDENKKRKGSRY